MHRRTSTIASAALAAALLLPGCSNRTARRDNVETGRKEVTAVPDDVRPGDYREVTVRLRDGRALTCVQWTKGRGREAGGLDCDWPER